MLTARKSPKVYDNIAVRVVDLFSRSKRATWFDRRSTENRQDDAAERYQQNAIGTTHPEVYMIILLLIETSEEVTMLARSVIAEVIASGIRITG